MNEIVIKFLLAGDRFVPEMHLRQSGFTYSACGPFTKNKQRIQKLKETGDSRYIYQNELDKACFQHDMTYGDFKDLIGRAASITNCSMKRLILLKIQSMIDIKEVLLQWSTNVLIKKLHLHMHGQRP